MGTISKGETLFKGIFISNIAAFLLIAVTKIILARQNGAGDGIFIFSEFVLIPIVMGIICIYYWRHYSDQFSKLFPFVLLNTIIAIILSFVILREGALCLLIVSPLILVFMLVGLVLGKSLFNKGNNTFKASTSILFLAIFIFDNFSEHNYQDIVTDEITINAPKDVVWKYIAAHPVNHSPNTYWFFRIGMPYPIQSTVSANKVGANRKCIFSDGAIFDETVVEYEKDSLFTFDVIEQPADPEIIGHIEIQRGQFILKENEDCSTTLIGKSWYKLNVYPAWYYNIWAKDITRNVHIRVMEHIKRLSENDI